MSERIYQARFDGPPVDVTPRNFGGLKYTVGEQGTVGEPVGRFVREVQEPVAILSPAEAAAYLMQRIYTPFEDFDQEEMWSLLVNNKYRVTHEVMVYRGKVNEIHIREAELLKEAVRVNAPALLISHCHPSGDPEPSPEDIIVTRKIYTAARILDLALLDHIIIGKACWVSLKERGAGFEILPGFPRL